MAEPDITTPKMPPLTLGRSIWALPKDTLARVIEAHRAHGPMLDALTIRAAAAIPQAALRRRPQTQNAGGAVAVIPLTGVLTPRGSFLSFLFGGGGGGLLDFRDTFRQALNDPDVGAIVLDVDSPGGLIDLTPETAQEIFDSRGEKPIVALANTTACSGAYYIASQCDEIVVTPSGRVGSIGVYMVHDDWSAFNEKMGVIPTYISAGEYKTEGNPDEPLSDDARADWQQEVDDLYAMFLAAVARGRGISTADVEASYGQGRTLIADRALQAGMVDRIATMEEVIGGLLVPSSRGGAAVRAGRLALIEPVRPHTQAPGGTADDEDDDGAEDRDGIPPEDQPPAADPDAGEDDNDEDDDEDDQPDAAAAAAIADVLLG